MQADPTILVLVDCDLDPRCICLGFGSMMCLGLLQLASRAEGQRVQRGGLQMSKMEPADVLRVENNNINNDTYLIFVIFCTRARFFKPKFYTQKRVN